MASVSWDGFNNLRVGRDFANAWSRPIQSHGVVRFANLTGEYVWESTLPIAESEHIIRQYATNGRSRVSLFVSQSGQLSGISG